MKKKVMIVGHENNLRSIIKRLDNISNEEIINLELPRAIPLLYHLDPDTLRPIKLEGATNLLSAKYLGDPEKIKAIADRDQAQVYDTSIKENLETAIKLQPTTTPIVLPDPSLKRKGVGGF
jgi:2,3-bisphosphoglycerate-dependent phosphoglycerate mutase